MRKISRQASEASVEPLYCDLTQSWSEQGGGVRTYLLHKRDHILASGSGRHLLIIPGARDSVIEDGRAITVTIASSQVPGSPNYRLLLRNRAVRDALGRFRPDLIECQDAYNLPWAALAHRKRHPATALVACYMTDFPTVYVERPTARFVGRWIARGAGRICYSYLARLYNRFDATCALSEAGGAARLRALGVDRVEVTPLGVEIGEFAPAKRDPALRARLGLADDQPLLAYAGRLDGEKKPDVVVDAFRRLPQSLGAQLVLLGDGPLRGDIAALGDRRIHLPGFVMDRSELARWLASADVYVSAMADETFGVSIAEAQASGLPVVGVAAGAMVDRVSPATGRLGPVGDSAAMAGNILAVLDGDRIAMAEAARSQALSFSWRRSMEIIFDEVYPRALARARSRGVMEPVQDGFTLNMEAG
ncbi:MAG: glycosyltransferase [Sphingomicrobium sp.]